MATRDTTKARRIATFLHVMSQFAPLTPKQMKIFRPILRDAANGNMSKNDLIQMAGTGGLHPAFNNIRELQQGDCGADVMSPLGLALSLLFNNFERVAPHIE